MSSNTINKDAKVVVSGVSGYVGSNVVKALIDRGFTNIYGSVRSLADESKVAHLKKLFPSHLHLFEADLNKPGSFDEGLQGAEYVLHTASPFVLVVEDPQTQLVDPAVNGTLEVLRAAEKAGTVKRIVVTSSICAVSDYHSAPGKIHTEADWSSDTSLKVAPYWYSKLLAEKAAWDFVEQGKDRAGVTFDIVTINPALILGPPLSSRSDSTSVTWITENLNGKYYDGGIFPLDYGIVDVRDVALAHVLAIENLNAKGRFIVSSEESHDFLDQNKLLKEEPEFQNYKLATKYSVEGHTPNIWRTDVSKSRNELGLQYTSLKDTMVDMARALIHFGLVTPSSN